LSQFRDTCPHEFVTRARELVVLGSLGRIAVTFEEETNERVT
jgi:hypothetical protein